MFKPQHLTLAGIALALALGLPTLAVSSQEKTADQGAQNAASQGEATLRTAEAFLKAAGMGDGETLKKLMDESFVWRNEGDESIPWIGVWKGEKEVFEKFMPAFGAGLKTTSWETEHSFVNKDQAVFMGTMSATLIASGAETGEFSWAVRVEVKDGKVLSWNWFENSYAISKAFHGS